MVKARVVAGPRAEATEEVSVAATGLAKAYPSEAGEARRVLSGLTLSLHGPQVVCLVGRSGSGKTTLLRLLAGQIQPDSGTVRVLGGPPARSRLDISYMEQHVTLVPYRNVLENVALPLELRGGESSIGRAATKWLRQVGLDGCPSLLPAALSGGMQRRVMLARTLITSAAVVLLDEPFSGLDIDTRIDMEDLTRRYVEERQALVVVVTHDIETAVAIGDRVVVMPAVGEPVETIVNESGRRGRDPLEFRETREYALGLRTVWQALRTSVQ